jgi:hypothetical protein
MTIAQPFMAGSSVNQMEKSREGRQNGSFVPDGTMEVCQPQVPAMNGWAIFNGARNGARIPNAAGAKGRVAHARGWAMTEIKWGRSPHSLPRRSNSPRRNAVMTGAKTGAPAIPHLNGSFPVFILGWTFGAIGVWPSRSDTMTIARHFNAGLVVKTIQVPGGRPNLPDEMEGHGGNIVPSGQPSLRDSWRCRRIPGVETPGYYRVVPLGRKTAHEAGR